MIIPYDKNWSSGARTTLDHTKLTPPSLRWCTPHTVYLQCLLHALLFTPPHPLFLPFSLSLFLFLSLHAGSSCWGFCFHQQRDRQDSKAKKSTVFLAHLQLIYCQINWQRSYLSFISFIRVFFCSQQTNSSYIKLRFLSAAHVSYLHISLSMQITGTLLLLQSEPGLLLVWNWLHD